MSDAIDRRRARVAEAMLLLTTAVWGASFALAKESAEAINRAAGDGRALGPILVLALRFTLGAICVAIAWSFVRSRHARREWRRAETHPNVGPERTRPGPGRTAPRPTLHVLRDSAALGGLLAISTILQHLALDRTSEAAAAFLTSLTVVFVPMILWVALGRRPGGAAWAGVALAMPGVWLMSGAAGGVTVGVGEALGVACAVSYAWHLLAVNRFAPRLGALGACLAQFATVGLVCWPLATALALRADHFDAAVLARPVVWGNVLLLVAGPTLVSFGLMAAYQPRVTPVRAVLIYLTEPIFAAAFAWLWTGRMVTRGELAGGALILLANVVVELLPVVWPRRVEAAPLPAVE